MTAAGVCAACPAPGSASGTGLRSAPAYRSNIIVPTDLCEASDHAPSVLSQGSRFH